MKKLALVTGAAILAATSLSFATTIQSLSKAQVTKTIQEKTITTIPLATLNDQLVPIAFTGYFNKNGQIQGQFANKPDNGPQSDQGKWTVRADGTLCATWDHWHESKPICVSVFKLKNGILFVNQQNKKFETIILDENIQDGNKIS